MRTCIKKAILYCGIMSLSLAGCQPRQPQFSSEKQAMERNEEKDRKE